ncbi:Wall-associated receptor kinase-like 2 [Bienertia sinuspersici]
MRGLWRGLCVLMINSITILIISATKIEIEIPLAKPGCPSHCGNVSVPYPFGIGLTCSLNADYNLNCSHTTITDNPPRLFLITTTILEVMEISIKGQMRLKTPLAYNHYKQGKLDLIDSSDGFPDDLFPYPQVFSDKANKLILIGCDDNVYLTSRTTNAHIRYNMTSSRSECQAYCHKLDEVVNGSCSGIGCNQVSIPNGLTTFLPRMESDYNHSQVPYNTYGYAFLAEEGTFTFNSNDLLHHTMLLNKIRNDVRVVTEWYVFDHGRSETCNQAQTNLSTYVCQNNTNCIDFETNSCIGYRCSCLPGYQGNPYLSPGCSDIDECASVDNPCSHICINIPGSYKCSCPKRHRGDGLKNGTRCTSDPSQLVAILGLGFGVSFGSIIVFLVGWWLYSFLKRRQIIKQQEINFKSNGGMLLRQQMSSDEGIVDRIKIFTINELLKATDNFNRDRILGQGGHGTVYKGMLDEGRVVAIKKSNKLEESQRDEFINEVVLLSQINHRNILKLLGCCLETEVPLLVYEFIPNGTLFHHIHNPSDEFRITWKMRLQIASDMAGALTYLHSSMSTLIFHRDFKSSNILLDEKYRAKLSDFGTSRSVTIDQTHVVTRVMGTFGYLDPEYFRSHQFTEKSDVYSFGVVLVELLTGQKAIRAASEEDRSLTSWFLSHMESSCVLDIIDSQVLQEGSKEEFLTIVDLAMRCLHLDGKKRPTMKEVLLEIEAVLSSHLPKPCHPNTQKIDQVLDGKTTTSTHSSIVNMESRVLDSAELSLLFNPR